MSVTKRLRFEILRRDNHTCRYCGASAPDVSLTVDHVTPVALGGTDEASNLVAACADCNSGKSSLAPDQQLVEDVSQDAVRWARAWRVAADESLSEKGRRDAYTSAFLEAWEQWNADLSWLPGDFDQAVAYWHKIGVPIEIVTEAVFIAMGKQHVPSRTVFRYMVGILRNRIAEIEQRARHLLESEEGV